MKSELVQITLPLTQEGLIGAALLLVLSGVVALALFGDGLKSKDDPMMRALKAFGWVYGVVWLFVFLGTLQTLWFVFTGTGPEGHGEDMRSLGMGALIAALLGAPFVIWGTVLKHQTVMFQKEGHMTDRINKAVEQLGAEKIVKKIVDGKTEETSEPNIEVRVGALLSLERIAQDSMRHDGGRDHIRVMSIIAAYIRQNSKIDTSCNENPYKALISSINSQSQSETFSVRMAKAFSEMDDSPQNSANDLAQWHANLRSKVRNDIQIALNIIGSRSRDQISLELGESYTSLVDRVAAISMRLSGPQKSCESLQTDLDAIKRKKYAIDLSFCNLQGYDLGDSNFDFVDFQYSRLEGAKLSNSSFLGSKLNDCRMCETEFDSCDFSFSDLHAISFIHCQGFNCRFAFVNFQFVTFLGGVFSGSIFYSVLFFGTRFANVNFSNALLFSRRSSSISFFNCRLSNAKLIKLDFRDDSDFFVADDEKLFSFGNYLEATCFKNVSFSEKVVFSADLGTTFGDASVRLPARAGQPAPHWPSWKLPIDESENDFFKQWELWKEQRQEYSPPRQPKR